MKHPLRAKDKKRLLHAALIAALAFLAAGFFGTVTAGDVVLALLLMALGIEVLVLHRSAESRARQEEALLSVFATLQPNAPLPDMQSWSAMPDLLKKLLELILMERSTLIVEAGSGASTPLSPLDRCLRCHPLLLRFLGAGLGGWLRGHRLGAYGHGCRQLKVVTR